MRDDFRHFRGGKTFNTFFIFINGYLITVTPLPVIHPSPAIKIAFLFQSEFHHMYTPCSLTLPPQTYKSRCYVLSILLLPSTLMYRHLPKCLLSTNVNSQCIKHFCVKLEIVNPAGRLHRQRPAGRKCREKTFLKR